MLRKIDFTNAPVVYFFTFSSVVVLVLSKLLIIPGLVNYFFSAPVSLLAFISPIGIFKMFSHVIGHADAAHLMGNFSFILILGPGLEEKYGSIRLLIMILATAFITGALNAAIFPTSLLGASGVVFMMIILSSITNPETGKIPFSLILVSILFLGKEAWHMIDNNNISEFAHIVGGICGGIYGLKFLKKKE